MQWWHLACWGLFGGFLVDGVELYRAVLRNHGRWPIRYRSWAFAIGECIRLFAGAGLAVAFSESGQINGALGALTIGAATPLIVDRISQVPTFQAPTIGDPK